MPVNLKIEYPDGQFTALWEITEDEYSLLQMASLDKAGLDTFSSLKNPGRRLEWLAVRALLKHFYPSVPTIDYLKNGKPILIGHSGKISISHSGRMVGISVHPDKAPGIDVEMLHPRIIKIADRFLAESEKIYVGSVPSVEQLTAIWGAKEVMFKVYGQDNISFKNDFEIKPFVLSLKGKLEGLVHRRNDSMIIPMEYMKVGDFMLVQTAY